MKGLVEGKKIILSPISLISSEPESLIRSLVWGDDVLLSLLELWVFLVNIRPVPGLSWSVWASWSIRRNCYVRCPSVKAQPIKSCTLSISNMLHPFPSIRNNNRNCQPPPLCCPDAKARHALHEQLRGSASLVSNPPSDLQPGIPRTWKSRDLDLDMGNVKITRTGRGNVEKRDGQGKSPQRSSIQVWKRIWEWYSLEKAHVSRPTMKNEFDFHPSLRNNFPSLWYFPSFPSPPFFSSAKNILLSPNMSLILLFRLSSPLKKILSFYR